MHNIQHHRTPWASFQKGLELLTVLVINKAVSERTDKASAFSYFQTHFVGFGIIFFCSYDEDVIMEIYP